MNRGQAYWFDIDGDRRPGIIVSREPLNRGTHVVVVFSTTQNLELRSKLPNCVPIAVGEFGFPKACVVQCEGITTIRANEIDAEDYIGT